MALPITGSTRAAQTTFLRRKTDSEIYLYFSLGRPLQHAVYTRFSEVSIPLLAETRAVVFPLPFFCIVFLEHGSSTAPAVPHCFFSSPSLSNPPVLHLTTHYPLPTTPSPSPHYPLPTTHYPLLNPSPPPSHPIPDTTPSPPSNDPHNSHIPTSLLAPTPLSITPDLTTHTNNNLKTRHCRSVDLAGPSKGKGKETSRNYNRKMRQERAGRKRRKVRWWRRARCVSTEAEQRRCVCTSKICIQRRRAQRLFSPDQSFLTIEDGSEIAPSLSRARA